MFALIQIKKKKNKKHFFKKEKAQQFLQMVMNRHAGEGVPSTGCVIVFPRFTLKRGNILLTLLFHCHGVEKSKQHWKGYDCRWKQTEKSLNGTSIHLLSKDLWKSLTNTELHSPQTELMWFLWPKGWKGSVSFMESGVMGQRAMVDIHTQKTENISSWIWV